MDWLFRRHFWMVHAAGVTLCAVLFALCVNVFIGYGLSKAFVVEDSVKTVNVPLSEGAKLARDFHIANERNLFGAKRESVSPSDAKETAASGESGRWQDAVSSGLRARLAGTAVFLDPRYSLAAIEDLNGSGPAMSYSINECPQKPTSIDPLIVSIIGPSVLAPLVPCNRLMNVAVIKRIEQGRVYLYNEQEHRYEYLAMEGSAGVLPPPPPPMLMPVASGAKEYGKSVRKTGANSYEIDASDLDAALSNMAELSTQARMVPAFENGKSIGFKIFSIKPGSVYEKIGLKDGDIISKMNGYEMNDPSKLVEAYGKLRSSSQVNLEVNGKTLEYSVVSGR